MILNSPYITGSLTVTGNIISSGSITISGSIASASYALTASNALTLEGLGSASFAPSSTFNTVSSSFATVSSSYASASGSLSTRVTKIEGNYATTGSNAFNGSQNITGSLTISQAVIAQTLNVQQVTSSIVYSCGSNVFGCSVSDVQQMTGSLRVTGSSPSYFLGSCVGIGTTSPAQKLHICGTGGSLTFGVDQANTSIIRGNVTANFDLNNEGGGCIRLYGSEVQFRTSAVDPAATIKNSGITCFACTVCIPSNLVLGTNNSYALYLRDSTGTPKPVMATAGSTNLNLYNVCSTGAIIINNSTDSGAIVRIDNTGVGCFAGTVCAPTTVATSVISNSTIAIAGNCSAAICLLKDYSGSPANPGLVIYNNAGTLTFQHNSNGGSTITGGNLLVSGVGCFSGALCASSAVLTGDLTVDTNTLYVDSTNNRVGIGTATPTQIFDIRKDANEQIAQIIENRTTGSAAVEALYFVENSTTYNAYGQLTRFNTGYTTNGLLSANRFWVAAGGGDLLLGTRTTNDVIFHSCGFATSNERMRITSAGNVGIGCTAPTYHLEVRCAASTSSCYLAAMFARSTGANDGVGDIIAFGANGVSSIAGIYRSSAGSWGLELQTANQNTRMRIDNSGITTFCCQVCAPNIIVNGCIGLGITSPSVNLDINATGGIAGFTGIRLKYGTSSVQSLSMGQVTAGNGAWIGMAQYRTAGYWQTEGTAASVISFESDGTFRISTNAGLTANTDYNICERMRITCCGNVGIGNASPDRRLYVADPSDTQGTFLAYNQGASYTGTVINAITDRTSNSAFNLMNLKSSTTSMFLVRGDGNVGIQCSSPGVALTIGGTDAIKVPVGTTAQRPTAATGMVRFNSSCTELEYYNGSEWLFFTASPVTQGYYADVLVVAGGGGGGGAESSNGFGGGGAGGGAGGYVAGRIFIDYTVQSYSITVGGGGAGGASYGQSVGSGCNGAQGGASCALGLVAIGGGFGAGDETGTGGGNGGSGGGNGGDNSGVCGRGVLGQGCIGGASNTRNGGGGGGASATGATGYTLGGGGGNGRTWLNGSTYAGGGGGGAGSAVQTTQSGGTGGGGNGSSTNGTSGADQSGGTATAGTANTGGGGGGAAAGRAQGGQNGGSGIVIIRYYGSQIGYGGTITSSGGYTYHTFTTSGTYCATYYV